MSLSFDNMAGSIATVFGKLWDTKTVCERANGLNIRLGLARLSFSRFGRGEKQGAFWRDESCETLHFYYEQHYYVIIYVIFFYVALVMCGESFLWGVSLHIIWQLLLGAQSGCLPPNRCQYTLKQVIFFLENLKIELFLICLPKSKKIAKKEAFHFSLCHRNWRSPLKMVFKEWPKWDVWVVLPNRGPMAAKIHQN